MVFLHRIAIRLHLIRFDVPISIELLCSKGVCADTFWQKVFALPVHSARAFFVVLLPLAFLVAKARDYRFAIQAVEFELERVSVTRLAQKML